MAPANSDYMHYDESQAVMRLRRSKGKSKGGCVGCKRRRVKCDEAHPNCSRCKTNGRSCVYETKSAPIWKDKVGILVLSPEVAQASLLPKIDVTIPKSEPAQTNLFKLFEEFRMPQYRLSTMPSTDLCSFSSEDSRLFSNFLSSTSQHLIGSQELWVQYAVKLAFQNNFLMHAILAVSARHLRHMRDSLKLKSADIYHHQRTLSTYQTAFGNNTVRINQDAVLATSLLLCVYSSSLLDFDPFASFPITDSSLTLYPGVRSIVTDAPQIAWNGLFRSVVTPPLFLRSQPPVIGPCAKLLNLLNTVPNSPCFMANKNLYIERIESLTLYVSNSVVQEHGTHVLDELLLCFLRWQCFCPPEFIALVRSFDPIALIILGHFYAAAGFVHSRAGKIFWWFEEKPPYMVRKISGYLSPQWNIWMEWPKSLIGRYGEGKVNRPAEQAVFKIWSSAVDDIDASSFPELYNWMALDA